MTPSLPSAAAPSLTSPCFVLSFPLSVPPNPTRNAARFLESPIDNVSTGVVCIIYVCIYVGCVVCVCVCARVCVCVCVCWVLTVRYIQHMHTCVICIT